MSKDTSKTTAPALDAIGLPILEKLTSDQVQSLHTDHGLHLGEINFDLGTAYVVKISQRNGRILMLNRRVVCVVLGISPDSPAVQQAGGGDDKNRKWCRLKLK